MRSLLLVVLLLIPAVAAGAPTREIEAFYVETQPSPLGVCMPPAGYSFACFDLVPGDEVLAVRIEDLTSAPIGFAWTFVSFAEEAVLHLDGSGCGATELGLVAPANASSSLLIDFAPSPPCPADATAGSVVATLRG